ncbi:APC family permease [Fervidicoccus fontis]|uniref:APC family permease n=1 Tax=Fervidicoccus fontis TaxID=683846 RepID=A0A843AF03_9CREN|nr:APC family permease [Fervidicoccus fontis]MBE9391666.1 APC family permease [Fervidicoccus fontis]
MTSQGLKRQVKWYVSAALVIGTLGATGLFGNLPVTYSMAGPAAALVWIVTLLFGAFAAVVLAYNFTIWPDKAGAEYAPVRIALGKIPGAIAGWGFYINWGTAGAIASLILGRYIFGTDPSTFLHRQLFAFALVTIFFVFNYFGIKIAGITQTILTILKVVPLILVGLVAIPFVNLSNFHPFWVSGVPGVQANTMEGMLMLFLSAALIATWSTYSTDIFASIVPEIEDPEKGIPRAAWFSVVVSLAFVSLITITAIGVLGSQMGTLSKPLFQYGQIVLGNAGEILLWIALVCGALTVPNVALMSASRVTYQMAVEGDMPKIFAKTNKYGVPYWGLILIYLINVIMIFYTAAYAVLVAIVQVPWIVCWFLLGVANLKIRATKEWHEKAIFKAPWWVVIGAFIVGLIGFGYCYAYGVLWGWHDIILGIVFVLLILVIMAVDSLVSRNKK